MRNLLVGALLTCAADRGGATTTAHRCIRRRPCVSRYHDLRRGGGSCDDDGPAWAVHAGYLFDLDRCGGASFILGGPTAVIFW